MGISKDKLGRFVRAAVVSGLLSAAGMVVVAAPVHAQTSDGASDGTSDGTSDGSSDGASDGASDGTTDNATDGSTDSTDTASDVGADSLATDDTIPLTGGSAAAPLLFGGAAAGIALASRRLLAARG